MPRRRRRQTLPALLVGSMAEAAVKVREKRAASERRRNGERGAIVAPLPRAKRRTRADPRPQPQSSVRRKTKRKERTGDPGRTYSRVVVLMLVLALGVPFFTMSGIKPAVAAGTISYAGHIGTGAELFGDCPGNPSQTLTATADSHAVEEAPLQTSGPASLMEVRSDPGAFKRRAFVRFDLPPVPAGCFVSSAALRLPVQNHAAGRTLLATRAASAWSEDTVNWSNQPAPVGNSASAGSNPTLVSWSVTPLVTDMYSSGNHGFIIRDASETSGSARQQFRTRENPPAPTLVVDFGAGFGTTVSITTTTSVPAGHSVVLSLAMDEAAGPLSASDSAGNAYSLDADASYAGSVRGAVLSAHNINALPAGSTITVTHPATGSRAVSANAFAGLAEAAAVDGSNAAAGFSSAPNSGAVSTTTPDSLLVGAFGVSGDATYSAGSGFTAMPGLVAPGQGQLATQYRIVSSTGSYSSTGTLSTNRAWAGGVAAYKMDTTLPSVQIDAPTDGSLAPATPTFEGISSTENSDSETIKLKLYSGTVASGTPVEVIDVPRQADGSWSYEHTTPLGDDVYTAQAEQEDVAGNIGLSNAVTFTVDTLAPDPPSVISPSPNPGNETSVAWDFIGEAGGTYECRLMLGSQVIEDYVACSSPAAYVLSDGDGIYTFSVRQLDEAGNIGEEASDDYVLDTGVPENPVVTGPDPDLSNNGDPVWSFTSEPGATTECRLMKGALEVSPFSDCTSPMTYALSDGDGTYTFSVRQTDRAGNVSGVSSDDYTLDTVVPETTIDSGPNGLTNNPNVSFDFSSDDPSAAFECNLDGGGFSPCTSPADYPTLGDGSHSFQVRAKDDAGNVDATPDLRTFTLDTGAPPLSIDNAPNDPGKDSSVTWEFSSEPGATIECELSRGGTVVSPFSDCSSGSATYDLGADGLYTFDVRASDAAGNVSTASDTYLLDTTDPESAASSTPLTSSPTITVGYTHSDGGSGVAEVELWVDTPGGGGYVLADTDTSLSGSFTYTATDGSGAYGFFTRARDAAGNYEAAPGGDDSQTMLDMDAPVVTIETAPSDPTSAESLTFTFSSADPTASFACSLTSDGTDAYVPCSSPASYPSPDVTTPYTFKVVATDPAGNVGPAATWSFMYVEPEPTPDPTPTETVEPTPDPTPTETVEPTPTETVEPTPDPTPTETVDPTPTETVDPTPTETVDPTPTETETVDPDPTETATVDPDPTETATVDPDPTETETVDPDPTETETVDPDPTEAPPTGGGGGTTARVDGPDVPNEPTQPVKEEKPQEGSQEPSRPQPAADDGGGGFFPQNAPSDAEDRLAELATLAAQAVKTFAFPLLLAILVIAFLLVQHWIDKKDPKLAMAPVHSNHDLTRFG